MGNRLGIGITGSFGSGCTTVSEVIKKNYNCKMYSLSKTLRDEWDKIHPNQTYTKEDLQNLGNQLRRENGLSYLAKETYKKVVADRNQTKAIVFDSIRNPAEIEFLRTKFKDFYVIAVDSAEGDRWERIKEKRISQQEPYLRTI